MPFNVVFLLLPTNNFHNNFTSALLGSFVLEVTMSSLWTELKPINFEFFPQLLKLNDHEFALVPSRRANDKQALYKPDGIFAFDTNINDWHKIIDYPTDLTTTSHSAVFHKEKNCIYVLNYSTHQLLEFDLTSQKMTKIDQEMTGFDCYPPLVLDGDEIHIFGNKDPPTHTIYDCKKKSISNIPGGDDETTRFNMHSFVHLASKKILLRFSITLQKLLIFSLSDRKWSETSCKVPDGIKTFALTTDDKHIIAISKDEIFVYDVEENIFSKSKVIPKDVYGRAIIMNNEKESNFLTFGFIRECLDELLPMDIMNIMVNWIKEESLYLIQNQLRGQHWKINMDRIMENITAI